MFIFFVFQELKMQWLQSCWKKQEKKKNVFIQWSEIRETTINQLYLI